MSRVWLATAAAAALFFTASCSDRPPFVVVNIEDPSDVATGFTSLGVGFSRDALSTVEVSSASFPLAVTVTAETAGEKTIWVAARGADGTALAYGKNPARFASSGTPTATVELARACLVDEECKTELFCAGTHRCQDEMCATTGLSCASNVSCVTATCVELGGGDGRCDVVADDSLCPANSYCSATAGCLSDCGNGLMDPGEGCDDGDSRDTGNGCSATCQQNSVCGDGVPQILFEECDDGDLDECNGCRTDCTRGCICADPQACVGANWCEQGLCVGCDVPTHCGPSCVACSGVTPLCGGADTGCVCDSSASLGQRGSCNPGAYCAASGACAPCDVTDHCGQECVACSVDTPACGGPEVGCIVDPPFNCGGKPDFTPCRVASPTRAYDICVSGVCVEPGCGDATCNPHGPSFARADVAATGWQYPDTGQRNCYNDSIAEAISCPSPGNPFYGQDGQCGWDATHAASERWARTDSAEPVVTDNVSGLVWQGCMGGRTGSSCVGAGRSVFSWSEALAYCDALVWNGYADWRLPDDYELLSIVDLGRGNPALDGTVFPENTAGVPFWSSTTFAPAATLKWFVDFSAGSFGISIENNLSAARCVRSGPSARPWGAGPRFTVDTSLGKPVVMDSKTGLMWQGCAAGTSGSDCTAGAATTYSWQSALAYCETLDWRYPGWRLPSRTELVSILDMSRASPAIDGSVFLPASTGASFHSSTSLAADGREAWAITTGSGTTNDIVKTTLAYVRCVRTGP